MLKLLLGLSLLAATGVWAETYEASISSIDYGRTPAEDHFLYLNDGHVIKLPEKNLKEIAEFERLKDDQKIIRFKTNSSREISSYKVIGTFRNEETHSFDSEYEPTVLNSQDEASSIFRNLKSGWRKSSQCYNRAHVWAYESKNKFNLDSMKVFIFYTRKYIRQYNFGWWFHVSPFTYVLENGIPAERVLDYRFTNSPLAIKSWTDIFMRNKVHCPVIQKFSDYLNHQEEQYCYLQKVSMYYLQPLDLDNLERTGKTKTQFLEYEVNRAYRNGFGRWWN